MCRCKAVTRLTRKRCRFPNSFPAALGVSTESLAWNKLGEERRGMVGLEVDAEGGAGGECVVTEVPAGRVSERRRGRSGGVSKDVGAEEGVGRAREEVRRGWEEAGI